MNFLYIWLAGMLLILLVTATLSVIGIFIFALYILVPHYALLIIGGIIVFPYLVGWLYNNVE